MKTNLRGFLTLLLAFIVQFTFAQERSISGTVSDETGPLPGVSIIIKGMVNGVLIGTETDFDGNYSLNAKTGDVLIFSFIGMTTQQKRVGTGNTIDVMLVADNILDEVIVTGYSTSTKKAFTGTATTVLAEALEIKNVSNIANALTGEVAGVTIINTSGQPGTTPTVRIRGYGSVNGNRAPLYVVDGVPFSGSLNSINPADIKSTTVLKDATATAIYGSRGANGVILINTKSGKAGESYIEIDVKTGMNTQSIPRYDVIQSPEEYIGTVWDGIYNRGVITGEADPVGYANANLFTAGYVDPGYNMWNVADGGELIDPLTRQVRPGVTRKYTPQLYSDAAFNSAFRTETSLRMGGGDEKTQYFSSFGYLNDDGYALRTSYNRYTTRLNVKSKIKKWLQVGSNIGYAYSESENNGQTNGSENLFEFADKMAPIFPVFLRDNNAQLVPDPIFGGYQYDFGASSGLRARPNADGLNPIATSLYDDVLSDRHELNGNFFMNIKFSSNLTFEARYGAQYSINRFKSFSNPFYGTGQADGGSLFTRDVERITQNFLQLLRYKNEFGDHTLEVLAAHESNEFTRTESTQFKGLAVVPDLLELDNFVVNISPATGYSEGSSINSYFAQVNYDFKDKYYITGSVRRDGSSRFVNEKWGTFGSLGGAWVVSSENFLNSNLLKFLKVKASYGITGDQAGVGYYSGYDTFNSSNLGGISISPRDNGNPDLTWETSKMLQTGIEFTLGTFLDGSVDYYNKRTDNLIFDRRVGPSQGIAIITVNDGELRNQGIEFDLTGHLFKGDFNLDLSVNGEVIKNEILTMPLEPSTGEPRIVDTSAGDYAYTLGSSIYDFYVREWAGVDPADGAPMWYQYFNDLNGNNILDGGEEGIQSMAQYLNDNPDATVARQITKTYADATDKYHGKSGIPDVRGAFRLAGNYKNFNFSTQFTYSIGGWARDNQYGELMADRFGAVGNNFHTDIANRWQEPGDITNIPRLADGIDQNATSQSTRFLTKTDHLALNNAMLGYTIPSKFLDKTGLSLVNIWVSGDNLFMKSARNGFNPTTSESGSSGRRLYAPLTTYTLGVRVKF